MTIWIYVLIHIIIISFLSTDIIKETCVPWGAYNSYAAEKGVTSYNFLITYLLPLMLIVFCYSRIVYALKHKVIPAL